MCIYLEDAFNSDVNPKSWTKNFRVHIIFFASS